MPTIKLPYTEEGEELVKVNGIKEGTGATSTIAFS